MVPNPKKNCSKCESVFKFKQNFVWCEVPVYESELRMTNNENRNDGTTVDEITVKETFNMYEIRVTRGF